MGGTGEDEVGGNGDEDAQEEEEGPGDHYVLSIRLVKAHPSEAESEAPELVINAGIRLLARQQRLDVAIGGHFHDDTSSKWS
ncbi:hypothetical protein GW17_00020203 [Ensete ventricosum]|nr:hypothetical protein GW17_00020203 [Ensete ventricosum]